MEINSQAEELFFRFQKFTGNTGGIDSWLAGEAKPIIAARLLRLSSEPLSCSQINQLFALSHQAEVSPGFFKYYWTSFPSHSFDVKQFVTYDKSYDLSKEILSLDQLEWGLERLYVDCLLYFGTIREGYRSLRTRSYEELQNFFEGKRLPTSQLMRRGPSLPLNQINRDDRYMIAELACKSMEIPEGKQNQLHLIAEGAYHQHLKRGGGRITIKELFGASFLESIQAMDRQIELNFVLEEVNDHVIETLEELKEILVDLTVTFNSARASALANTKLYLSIANDLDVYVATSMRVRSNFRDVAKICGTLFEHKEVSDLNLRFFDPTLSAARGHEDKGLIECLMVKCAKVLVYLAGEKDSYGKDAEAAMALSLGKPVIFLCDSEERHKIFSDIHPLSRLIDFQTGVAVGVMAATSPEQVVELLKRIFHNKMEYSLEQPRVGQFRLIEKVTGSTIRIQTSDQLLRETFWNCYHKPHSAAI